MLSALLTAGSARPWERDLKHANEGRLSLADRGIYAMEGAPFVARKLE